MSPSPAASDGAGRQQRQTTVTTARASFVLFRSLRSLLPLLLLLLSPLLLSSTCTSAAVVSRSRLRSPGNPLEPFEEHAAEEAGVLAPGETIGPKCHDPPFNGLPSNGFHIPNACCHPKFHVPLLIPPTMPHCFTDSTGKDHYGVSMRQISQRFGLVNRSTHSADVDTEVWAFGADCTETFEERIYKYAGPNNDLSILSLNTPEAIAAVGHSFPGPTFDFVSNEPVFVLFKNELPTTHLNQDTLDERRNDLHCGIGAPGCRPDVRTTIHFHGGHTHPQYDGHPYGWFTQNTPIDAVKIDRARLNGTAGEKFFSREYYYLIDQEAGMFWYHDHSMGITAINVYAGLVGLLVIRDQREHALQVSGVLPSGEYEVPLALKDYWFHPKTGAIWNQLFGVKSLFNTSHARSQSGDVLWLVMGGRVEHEFFGNYSVVNGQVWPYLEVSPTRYRFRVLNACNSRILRLSFQVDRHDESAFDDDCHGNRPGRWQHRDKLNVTIVMSDGGLLFQPAPVAEWWQIPAERYDVVVDFSPYAGRNVTLHNSGPVEMGLPWRCPPNCEPDFNTGPDRWVRFVVRPELRPDERGERDAQRGSSSDAGAHKQARRMATSAGDRDDPTSSSSTADAASASSGAEQASSTSSASGSASSPTSGAQSRPEHGGGQSDDDADSAAGVSYFGRATSNVTSPFPRSFRGPWLTGAVDRVRQIVMIEVSHSVAFSFAHQHPGMAPPAPRQPTVVTVNEQGEVHNNNNLRHGGDGQGDGSGGREDEIYMFTVNDPRFETGTFFDNIVSTAEQCTTERWELINISNDTHAIHLHINQYELIGRANFSFFRFGQDPVIRPGTIRPPEPYERGPKDLFMVHPGEVLYLQGFFDFPGRFVYHCHMLEHEDMEMMHTLEVIPSKCACVMSPLLRESEIVPAPGLPVPYGMDAESKRQRAQMKKERRADRRDAEQVYAEWREELIRRNPQPIVPSCAAPPCAYPAPLDRSALFGGGAGQCAAADKHRSSGGSDSEEESDIGSPAGTCPINLFSDWLFLRDSLFRSAPLTCQSAAEASWQGDDCSDPASVLSAPVAAVDVNRLHASVCPGEVECSVTTEGREASRELDPTSRVRLAIAEGEATQRDVPRGGTPLGGFTDGRPSGSRGGRGGPMDVHAHAAAIFAQQLRIGHNHHHKHAV